MLVEQLRTVRAALDLACRSMIYAMSGHYFIRDGEVLLENAASKDKDYIVIEGANHSMVACQPCAKAAGKDYGNATSNLFDNVAAWTKQRFAK